MKLRATLLALACIALPLAARAETTVGGIAIGETIAATVHDLGMPLRVESSDTGNAFTFPSSIAYVDDDGVVRAVQTSVGTVSVVLDGKPATFAIGESTTDRADALYASVGEYSSDTLRSYRLTPQRELALFFDKATHRLTHAYYGERGALARLGILPGDDITTTVPYRAPKLRGSAVSGTSGALATIVRYEIDARGSVTNLSIAVPSSDPAADTDLLKRLAGDRYVPAQLGGRAIGSVVFRDVRR